MRLRRFVTIGWDGAVVRGGRTRLLGYPLPVRP